MSTTTIYSIYTDSAQAKQASIYSAQLAQEQTRTATLTRGGATVFNSNSNPGSTATVILDPAQSQHHRFALGVYSVLREGYPTVTDFSHGTYTISNLPSGLSPQPDEGGAVAPYCIPQPTPTPMPLPVNLCVCPKIGNGNAIVTGGNMNVGVGYVPKYPGTGSDGNIMTMASGGSKVISVGANLYIIIAFVGLVLHAC